MSRIDELKKQYKEFALCDLDIMKMAVPDQANKYVEMLAKLTKNLIDSSHLNPYRGMEGDYLRKELVTHLVSYGIDYNYLETLETQILYTLYRRIDSVLGKSKIELFNRFAQLNERKLINQNDVTKYSTFEEVEQAVSLAEMKLLDKELEKQIIKVYEDDEWLSLKPLSLAASMKYGANTKWCTTMESGQYFARYSRWGILIYNINKKTGFKFATFKNLDTNRDKEFSFWNMADSKIDPLDTPEIPTSILEVIRKEINERCVPNTYFMTKEQNKNLDEPNNTIDDGIRLHISGGFATTGTSTTLSVGGSGGIISTINSNGTTIAYNPSTFTSTGTIGMSNPTPSTQLSISGNIEINDGDLIIRSNGEERMRVTSSGLEGIGLSEPPVEQFNPFEQPDEQYRIDDARERLEQEIEAHLERTSERVVEERAQQSLLTDIEMGTLNNDMILKMQALAGIKNTRQQIQALETEIEQIRAKIREEEPEAEQPIIPSESKSVWKRIKSLIK